MRLLSCRQLLKPRAGGPAHRELLRERLGALAAHLPAGHGLQVLVEAEPLDPTRTLARDWEHVELAAADAQTHGDEERARAMRRLALGLEQTVRRSAPAVQAAALRWTIAVRWSPTGLPRRRRGRGVRVIARAAHERAAADSARLAELVAGDLVAAGCQVDALDGEQALAALARMINPAAGERMLAAGAPQVLESADRDQALAHRAELLAALGAAELRVERDWLARPGSGEIEAIAHLSGAPGDTSVWWLLALMELPPPWRLAVHVTATDRVRQRRRFRLRHRRLWADLRRRERDGKLISEEAYQQEREAADIDAELRLTGAAGIYEVSIYQAIRRPAGDREQLTELLAGVARDFESYTDARLYTGRFLAEPSWVSTLPLATDRLGATRRFAQRNIGDCLPLHSLSASSPGGVPLGYALPGSTLERVDPFDPAYRTHVALITGASGSGKTVATNALLARNLARGATGYIIDRSSSEHAAGGARHAGHYEQLAALIPGARVIHYGAGQQDAIINPWDTPNPAHVPASKVEFLVALHALLVGDPTPTGHALTGLERSLLARAIHQSYAHCAQTGELPRERVLREQLRALARAQADDTRDGDSGVAGELRRLAERLYPYVQDGPLAWLADRPTTIPAGAPLVVFDLAGLPDALAAPVILALVDHIDREIARRRAQHLTDHRAGGEWAGRTFLAIDEAWKPLMTPAAGAWLNEWARRTRHIACALLVISQHLSDFANPQGRALLRNSVLRLLFHTAHDELAEIADTLDLHAEDLAEISALQTRKGEHSTCLLDSEAHGRATVRIQLSDIEYWACSADPERDQPLRELALRQSGGDAWAAMRLLVDAAWHRAQAEQLAGDTPAARS
ncbi:VirB4 family type IV secretion system protein [Solirubrobacter deserti]|uniref:AAA+ ATPase domain-containing protein n=1 Tax=Solirubrobacter deserti TaxID=2282478 RepID=A0ABT4RLL7_9ACTN|nr:hypothetical protein [Solirubrobacter deserti]MDA0139426.1 hypothetical protein [Solirubrobacter deserti]